MVGIYSVYYFILLTIKRMVGVVFIVSTFGCIPINPLLLMEATECVVWNAYQYYPFFDTSLPWLITQYEKRTT